MNRSTPAPSDLKGGGKALWRKTTREFDSIPSNWSFCISFV
jgi:hypothetical protein